MRTVIDRCVACGQQIETTWDDAPCGGEYLVHVEGYCPVTDDYHEPSYSADETPAAVVGRDGDA